MEKVFVGLSGGVDSATSAALLKEQGYDVTGVFIKIWSPEFLECTWRDDRLDAMRAAVHLGIPFEEVDLSAQYQREIVGNMIDSYKAGITPNPDVLCNKVIKFGAFAEWAFEKGANFVAMGHYARIERKDGIYRLLRGKDPAKDQSYFVYEMGAGLLPRVLFPVGAMVKSEVRTAARRFGLPVAEKPDSQGLCFVGDVSLPVFLSRFIELKKGSVLDTAGKQVGEHDGAALYTLGQRHGFRIRDTSEHEPHYVIAVDADANEITVSPNKRDAERLSTNVTKVSWLSKPSTPKFEADVQCRYREPAIKANIAHVGSDELQVTFSSARIASAGQSLVMYDGDTVLGGGVIK